MRVKLIGLDKVKERQEKEMEDLKKRLSRVRDRLDHAYSWLEEARCDVNELEEEWNEIKLTMDLLEDEMKEEATRIRCQKCSREFTEEDILNNLEKDAFGEFWRCPEKMCNFKGYCENGKYTIEFSEMKSIRNNKHRKYLEKTFYKLDKFINILNI